MTFRHLESIGVSEGWKFLEIGAGAGSIAKWLSSRVGPTGKVVATDIDLRFLSRIGAPNLEIRRHDILVDDLEKDHYDLAHCRFLLQHLPAPEKALQRMLDAVRRGGWMLIEEHDHGSVLSMDVADPSLARFARTSRVVNDFLRKRDIMDVYFGRRVRGLVEQLGLVDVGQEGYTYVVRGGDPMARGVASAMHLNKPMIAERLLTQEDLDDAVRVLLDPAVSIPGQTMFSARAVIAAGLVTREIAEDVHRLVLDPHFNYLARTIFSAWGRKPVQGGGT